MPKQLVIAVPCWGDRYRRIFFGPVLRSHRAALAHLAAVFQNTAKVRYVIQTDRRDELKAYLAERGIGSQVHYRPVYDHPYYRDYPRNCPNAERFAKRCLSLPLYPTLSESDQDRVIEAINAFSA